MDTEFAAFLTYGGHGSIGQNRTTLSTNTLPVIFFSEYLLPVAGLTLTLLACTGNIGTVRSVLSYDLARFTSCVFRKVLRILTHDPSSTLWRLQAILRFIIGTGLGITAMKASWRRRVKIDIQALLFISVPWDLTRALAEKEGEIRELRRELTRLKVRSSTCLVCIAITISSIMSYTTAGATSSSGHNTWEYF